MNQRIQKLLKIQLTASVILTAYLIIIHPFDLIRFLLTIIIIGIPIGLLFPTNGN